MARIDICWVGREYPIRVTDGANEQYIGMEASDWLRPWELVCIDLQIDLETKFPTRTWSVHYTDYQLHLECSVAVDWQLQPGFATAHGFDNTTYLATTAIQGEPEYMTVLDQDIGMSCPGMIWSRVVAGGKPVVLSGPWTVVSVTHHCAFGSEGSWYRVPHCIITDDTVAPWAPDNLDGYFALRPLPGDRRRINRYQTLAVGDWTYEAAVV